MFTVSATKLLNEAGKAPLHPDELWRAMEHHIRTGDQRFVPPGHAFETISDGEGEVLRWAILSDATQQIRIPQRVSLHAGRAMLMSTTEGPLNIRIMTIEADAAGQYCLRLVHSAIARGADHGSPEEQDVARTRQKSVEESAARFVEVARAMSVSGELARHIGEQDASLAREGY